MESGLVVIIAAAFVIGAVAIARFKKKDQETQDLQVPAVDGGNLVEAHALKKVKNEDTKPAKKKPGRKPSAKKVAVKKQK